MQKHVVDWDTSGTDEADPVGITSLSWAPLATPWCPYCFWFCFTLLRCGCDSTVKVLEENRLLMLVPLTWSPWLLINGSNNLYSWLHDQVINYISSLATSFWHRIGCLQAAYIHHSILWLLLEKENCIGNMHGSTDLRLIFMQLSFFVLKYLAATLSLSLSLCSSDRNPCYVADLSLSNPHHCFFPIPFINPQRWSPMRNW